VLDAALRRHPCELRRILIHEIYHFVWVRLNNSRRRSWEAVLAAEQGNGELGWSAEWRRRALRPRDVTLRSRRWREYCCESFCDTAAWLLAGLRDHEEFTLRPSFRARRAEWFASLPDSLKV